MDFVEKVKHFNELRGTTEKFNHRNVALYTALQLEELREKIESLLPNNDEEDSGMSQLFQLIDTLSFFENEFKRGVFDHLVENIDRVAGLDADIDLAVVALGGAIAMGCDVCGVCHHVADNNLSKMPVINGVITVIKDENGKVVKPNNYVAANVEPYLVGY